MEDDIVGVGMPLEGPPPECGRCGTTSLDRTYLGTPELGIVCIRCLTDDEYAQFRQDMADAIRARRN